MTTPTVGTLARPSARLYYEVRGSGPALLLVPGGSGEATGYARLAAQLADRYTVVSYDRRGFSRSPLDGPVSDGRRLAADVDDALGLLDQVTDRPAAVFGSSSGAIVALDLLVRDPQRFTRVVAHEPPLVCLLPDAAQHLALFDGVYDTYRREGVDAALTEFNTGLGLGELPRPPAGAQLPPHVVEMLARLARNQAFWLEHELRQYTRVRPDLAALRAAVLRDAALRDAAPRLVLAGGVESRGQVPYRPNAVLAERLGIPLVEFPGGHVGYVTHPEDFAARLVAVL
jgi:pimeloyl-ACP methyl ester carboxylesterase